MKYALFIAEISQTKPREENKSWSSFVAYAEQDTGQNQDVSKLNDGTYLCNLSDGLNSLSLLVQQAKNFEVPSRTLFFDQDPSWVITNNKD